jgi:hypothetical protein
MCFCTGMRKYTCYRSVEVTVQVCRIDTELIAFLTTRTTQIETASIGRWVRCMSTRFFLGLIIYSEAYFITYAILHALFCLPHCLSSCDIHRMYGLILYVYVIGFVLFVYWFGSFGVFVPS